MPQIFFDEVDGKKVFMGGLLPHEKDERDFQVGSIFGLFPYQPKQQRVELQTYSTKNQGQLNTCGWNSVTVQKEADEKMPLSVRQLVTKARKEGLLVDTGYSALRDNQKAVKWYGIAEQSLVPETGDSWDDYSNSNILTTDVLANAAIHRSGSFWEARKLEDMLKALDQGRVLQTGLDWYSGYNMNGGLTAPWILEPCKGQIVGGHAVIIIGYDLNYNGRKVLILKNSYGEWGDHGKFYVPFEAVNSILYTSYAQLDIPSDVAKTIDVGKFLTDYQLKFVKGKGPAVYEIIGQKKYAFPDMATFLTYAFPQDTRAIMSVDDLTLSQVEQADNMITLDNASCYQKLKDLAPLINTLISQNKWDEVNRQLGSILNQ